jgi:hypothetical protein
MGQAQGFNTFGCCRPEDRKPEPVTLNIYDLHGNGRAIFKGMNFLLRAAGTGAFHVGVEVFNQEWSFGHKDGGGTGVYSQTPRESELHSYRESIFMGDTDLTQYEVSKLVKNMSARWNGDSYDVLNRNCCHFCDELCMELHVGRPSFVPLPEWLNSLVSAGAALGVGQDHGASEESKLPALDNSPDMDGGKSSRKRPSSAQNRTDNTPRKNERSTARQTNESRGLTMTFELKW